MEEEFFRKSASVGCLATLHADYATRHTTVSLKLQPKQKDLNETGKNSTKIPSMISGKGTQIFVIGVLTFLIAVLSGGVIQQVIDGRSQTPMFDQTAACLNLEEMPQFNFDRFLGSWYLLAQLQVTSCDGHQPFCLKADFTSAQKDAHDVQFTFAHVNCNTTEVNTSGQPRNLENCIHQEVQTSSGTLNINNKSSKSDKIWKVLQTDYDNIAVLHSCQNLIAGRVSEYVFVLGRSINLDPMDMGDILDMFANWGLPYRQIQFSPLNACSKVF